MALTSFFDLGGAFCPTLSIWQERRHIIQIFNRKICLPFNIRVKGGKFTLGYWRESIFFLIEMLSLRFGAVLFSAIS